MSSISFSNLQLDALIIADHTFCMCTESSYCITDYFQSVSNRTTVLMSTDTLVSLRLKTKQKQGKASSLTGWVWVWEAEIQTPFFSQSQPFPREEKIETGYCRFPTNHQYLFHFIFPVYMMCQEDQQSKFTTILNIVPCQKMSTHTPTERG